jgi:haloacetate dehalogenase
MTINLVQGGRGDLILLLHGYPETHLCWHRVAPNLAEGFTVICPDLRGYGDIAKPPSEPEQMSLFHSTKLLCRKLNQREQIKYQASRSPIT